MKSRNGSKTLINGVKNSNRDRMLYEKYAQITKEKKSFININLDPALSVIDTKLKDLIQKSISYVSTLPPKEPKKKKK